MIIHWLVLQFTANHNYDTSQLAIHMVSNDHSSILMKIAGLKNKKIYIYKLLEEKEMKNQWKSCRETKLYPLKTYPFFRDDTRQQIKLGRPY